MLVLKNQTIGLACFIVFLFFLHVTLTSVIDSSPQSPELESCTLKIKPQLSPTGPITCDRSHEDYDLCSINGPALLDPTTATFFSVGLTNMTPPSFLMKTKPYPRKPDKEAMSRVKEVTLTSAPPKVSCGVTHTSPAIVFSAGGYFENSFHQFMDGFLPLYITINFLLPDDHQNDVILVITDYKDWWSRKYAELLAHFSHHPIVNMDNDTITHCFPSVNVGLDNTCQGDTDTTMYQFRQPNTRPRLLLMNRKAKVGRMILNLEEVKKTAEVVGFDVIKLEPTVDTSLLELFRLIQASHAMLGGNADMCFGDPASILGFQYLDYKIRYEESSLAERYARNDLALTNPEAFIGGLWKNMLVYLNQNLKLDMVKFKIFLKDAYKKAKRFMDEEIG
ncbi:hypothetical protein Pint_23553 [Pistacia integerrima]|uniref:Uncharacterized protein n=1 Tax=Pistacia integerrima TaxID=434235 RepID=A0ACC0YNT6_9ROSI|nr:hypothetical protein Pint_23553 [Pistacia integerrima]